VGEQDLAGSGSRLRILEAPLVARHAQVLATQADCARGHHQHLLAACLQACKLIGDGFQPGTIEPSRFPVDQQRRADLEYETAGTAQRSVAVMQLLDL
jgi:hypothetical protein